jgi:3D (Asp-Asp-Asp) domain-containing protein
MRIISKLLVLLLVGVIFTPYAMAAELLNTDETNTNLNIQNNIQMINGTAYNQLNLLAYAPEAYVGYEPVRDPVDAVRAVVLDRYSAALKNANFPKGKFNINASAYTASADECGNSKGITASGLKVMSKRTLACPPQFPLGAKISIDGMGTYVCEDRGGAIKGNHFDIYMQTKQEAFAFGRRNLIAEVVL